MIISLIILAYIVNVFLARWFNKLAYKINDLYESFPLVWFLPFVGMVAYFIIFLIEYYKSNKKSNWFTGKNW